MALQATMQLLSSGMLDGSTACRKVCHTCLGLQVMVAAAPADLVSQVTDQLRGEEERPDFNDAVDQARQAVEHGQADDQRQHLLLNKWKWPSRCQHLNEGEAQTC